MQEAAPPVEKDPTAQGAQACAPVLDPLYVIGGQGVQTADPLVFEYWPKGQAAHVEKEEA